MKITAIAKSHSDQTQTAFKTEPALTEEVMQCAIENFFGPAYVDHFFVEDGLFIVRRAVIPKDQVTEYERSLTQAENLLQKRKENADQNREGHLKRVSEDTGLPIE